ncbi:MAG TPA: hypothetical protein DEA32_01965 [Firmicutes bacterium]|nr:hypothetical protein [Bacillota bacterium]
MGESLTSSRTDRKKPNWVARAFGALGVILGITLLASCTKSFMSDADKTNVMYSYYYGQDSNKYQDELNGKTDGTYGNATTIMTSIVSGGTTARPSQNFMNYMFGVTYDYTDVLADQGDGSFKVTKYPSPVVYTAESVGEYLSGPQQWIDANLFKENNVDTLNGHFGKTEMATIGIDSVIKVDTSDETEDKLQAMTEYIDAFQSVKAMAVFGGFNDSDKVTLWSNFDSNWDSFQDKFSAEDLPAGGFVKSFESTMNSSANSNRAGLNTSTEGGMYGQDGQKIYITPKTWGQAFRDYGFFEGLLVWPFGWLINSMSNAFASLGHGWAEFFAIMILTILVRSILLVFSIFSNRSQARMNSLQPEISALQSKYPNAQTNREEKTALSRETAALYKKAGVKPWISIVMLIVQFPLFICVWSALEGSAVLSSGNFYGINLTQTMMSAMSTNAAGVGTRVLAIFLFIFMAAAQVLSSQLMMWFQTWRQKKFSVTTVKVDPNANSSTKVMKYVSWGMTIFVFFMGFQLPVAMSIYWYFGALMSIVQALITELITRHNRNKHVKDGDSLSAIRRSKHHDDRLKSIRNSK